MSFLFTYGTLCSGRSNNRLLGKSKLLGSAETQEKYLLFDNGRFPGMVNKPGTHQIEGEVYEISDETLRACDRLEGHPHFYIRKEIKCEVLDGDGPCEGIMFLDCWAYFIQPPYYETWKQIEGGLWSPKQLPLAIY